MLVFDNVEWGGKDKGDNEQFWHPATILAVYTKGDDLLARVQFHHSGRISSGHFVSAMRKIR
jgi:hypothetical protein